MKELLRKKSVKISLLLIIFLVVMGIVGINAQSAQKNKEYEAHIVAAEKYLSDLDYEQAIAEYAMAFEVDPKEEVVDALEQTYFAYVQTYIDAGDFEKAVSILEEGYEKIGRESLQNKIAEVRALQAQKQLEEEQRRIEEEQRASGMVEFPFQVTDITVMGYDLLEDHFEQVHRLFPTDADDRHFMEPHDIVRTSFIEQGTDPSHGNYWMEGYIYDSGEMKRLQSGIGWTYDIYYDYLSIGDRVKATIASLSLNSYGQMSDYEGIQAPLKAGETYEDWCRVMQIDQIKENDLHLEERDGMLGIWDEDGKTRFSTADVGDGFEYWLFSTEGCLGVYMEHDTGNGDRLCCLSFCIPDTWVSGEPLFETIQMNIGEDGAIKSIVYRSRL